MLPLHKTSKYAVLIGLSSLLCSCTEEKPVSYVEKIEKETVAKVEQTADKKVESHAFAKSDIPSPRQKEQQGPFSWKLPQDWTETKSQGIIIAKFSIPALENYRCYITRLAGNGGGIGPNIQRWLGQLQLPALASQEAVDEFLAKQKKFTVPGGNAAIIDFSEQVADETKPSMVVGIVSYSDQTLYVKLQGAKGAIEKHVAQLSKLTQSITRN